MIEGHGDDIYRYKGKVIDNFSSNIYMGADHSSLIDYISRNLADISSYPNPSADNLARDIASVKNIAKGNIIVTNGCTECIYLIAQAFRGNKTAIAAPTFSEYNDACKINEMDITLIDSLDELSDDFDVVWICNPNNPTGKVIPKNLLQTAIQQHPSTVFVIDQAYESYTCEDVLSAQDAVISGNMILLNSLTKDYSIPGLRIGYAISSEHIILKLKNIHMPWAVNSVALTAGEYLIRNRHKYIIPGEKLHEEALRISEEFEKMGINVTPTDCNFILCQLSFGLASELKNDLIERYGILIRDASNFTGLTPRHFRIAAQSPEQNDRLIKAIKLWMSV